MMRNSIAVRIFMILFFLTFLFTLNTVLSGVTNTQVQLSADLISDSFVDLEYQQIKLNKEISNIRMLLQSYELESDAGNAGSIAGVESSVENVRNAQERIGQICAEFSKKAMNPNLENIYQPYSESIKSFLDQVMVQKDRTELIDMEQLSIALQNMNTAEIAFQQVLDESIAHEITLVHSRVNRSTVIIWGMAILFIIAAAVSFGMSMKTIIRPLKNVNQDFGKIIEALEDNQGDLTLRLMNQSEDEIGQIIDGINRFLEMLQTAMISIKSGSEVIHGSSEIIYNHMNQSKELTSNISSSLNELSASMEEINSTLATIDAGAQKVLVSADQMEEQAKQNSERISMIAVHADQLYEKTHHSKEETLDMIGSIRESMDEAIKSSRSVERINILTENILGISAQTNLLALNASIEAARAGTAGKGFSVVADEIRKLAENTKETASDIQNISHMVTDAVEELVKNAEGIMIYMDRNVLNDYDDFVELAGDYKKDTESMSQLLNSFKKSATQLRKISEDIAGGIQGITSAVEESVTVVIHAGEDTSELLDSVTNTTIEAGKNEMIVGELNEQLNRFKKVELTERVIL
ncbi:MAG: methyl-accepting chemotaxis protein [Lachnospiraceae bacterium]|nr:methyl-accepting chemotaxis protein [Lachnospiraceae bacterium]MDD3659888.1 methyl-accepting chemotaxis protein [Lachnospiraceae bacterium]